MRNKRWAPAAAFSSWLVLGLLDSTVGFTEHQDFMIPAFARKHLLRPPSADLPCMITTVSVREERRGQLPAITHANGSARVQTVSETDNPRFYQFLKAMGKTTGREMALNTSIHGKGQPIVNTPR